MPRDTVVVLKGVPLSLFGEVADLDAAANDPLNYFLRTGENFCRTKKLLLEHLARLEDADNPDEENFLLAAYDDDKLLSKVTALNLFAPVDVELDEIDATSNSIVDVCDEADFVKLAHEIICNAPTEIFVRTHNFACDLCKFSRPSDTATRTRKFCDESGITTPSRRLKFMTSTREKISPRRVCHDTDGRG